MHSWAGDSPPSPDRSMTPALNLLSSILCYIVGAMVPGAMLHKRKPWALEPEYGPCFLIGAGILVAASLVAENYPEGIMYYLLLCAASGLQNGMTSTFSANLIRTSHLSGTTTDIGLIIGQKLRGTHTSTWKLHVLVLLTLSFFVGGLVSYPASQHWGFHAVILNISVLSITGIAACYNIVKEYGISMLDSMFGTEYKWEKVFRGLDITTEAHIHEILDKIRWNADGVVTEEELDDFFKQQGLRVNENYLGILIEQADADGDGYLSREEMLQILQSTRREIEALQRGAISPSLSPAGSALVSPSSSAKDLPSSQVDDHLEGSRGTLSHRQEPEHNGRARTESVHSSGLEMVPLPLPLPLLQQAGGDADEQYKDTV